MGGCFRWVVSEVLFEEMTFELIISLKRKKQKGSKRPEGENNPSRKISSAKILICVNLWVGGGDRVTGAQ